MFPIASSADQLERGDAFGRHYLASFGILRRSADKWLTVMARLRSRLIPNASPTVSDRSRPQHLGDVRTDLLRTTRSGVYAMVARAQLPGMTTLGRRVLIRSDLLLTSLRTCRRTISDQSPSHPMRRVTRRGRGDRHRGTESRTGAPAFTGLSVISFTSTVDWVTSILMSPALQIAPFSETMAPRTKYVALPTSL
jgi:hypothetical protein